jgi:PKD repeat protein
VKLGRQAPGALVPVAILLVVALLAAPALAGNTVTATGDIPAQPPVAQFTGIPTSGTVPLTVQFTDQSTHTPASWMWEYQKSGTSTWTQFSVAQNPAYTFAATGTYSIRLTATNAGGSGTVAKTGYITVSTPLAPVAAFTATPTSGYAPLAVQFTDQSTNNPTSWKWEYKLSSGSWTQFSTAKNPAYTFAATGTYGIRLTATNAGGSGTVTKTGYITVSTPPKPVAAFTATPTSGLPPLAVQFTDQSRNSPTSWKWEYQKVGTSTWTQFSTAQNPAYTFTTIGQYSIRLTATNAGGSGTLTKTGYITVGHCGVIIPSFTGSPTSGAKPLIVQFKDGSSGPVDTWEWDFQNDGTYDNTVQNPSFTYTAKNKYSVKLRVTNACATGIMIRYTYINVQ